MTKQEADNIFDSKGEEALNKLLDYVLIEDDCNKATEFIVQIVGCDETIAREMIQDISPSNTKKTPVRQSNIPHCPTCNSTDIKRISTTAKVTNIAMFGLLGNKRKKTFHCNSCKYEW